MSTRADFAHDVLLGVAGVSGMDYLGSRWALMGWSVGESGSEPCDGVNGARYNIFNTEWKMPGSTDYNSVGVQNYTSYNQGVQATVATLKQSLYVDIVDALKEAGEINRALRSMWEITQSVWGTSVADGFDGLDTFLADKTKYNVLTVG